MTNIRIRNRDEETECAFCGFPLYVGDRAELRAEQILCSPACADRYREALELRHDDAAAHTFGAAID